MFNLDIPVLPNFSSTVPYNLDNSGSITGEFDRIGYYLELDNGTTREWVWASMDAFTQDLTQIGVPNLSSGAVWQLVVDNMNIESNKPGIVTGTGIDGNIEFWPYNYATAPGVAGIGGNASVYDFNDTPTIGSGDHASMQIHNYSAGQTVFGFNHWNRGLPAEIGIGNAPSVHTDWTGTATSQNFVVRDLEVWVSAMAAPEPGGHSILTLGLLGLLRFRRRR